MPTYDAAVPVAADNTSHALMLRLVGPDRRVLDVGCATGYLGEALMAQGCRVSGVEYDPEAADRAKGVLDEVLVADLETTDLVEHFGPGSFDVVVFGDVLEHLKDPQAVLSGLRRFLRPAGYAVASIPNIAHASVRLALLQGEFRYRSLGLMDNTHLKFFTSETVEQLFEESGFLISDLRRTVQGVFDTEIEFDRDAVPQDVLRQVQEDPEALTYQFVLTAHPLGESATLATYERLLYDLSRKLRQMEDLRGALSVRDRLLFEKEREVAKLTEQVTGLKDQLAKLTQSSRGEI